MINEEDIIKRFENIEDSIKELKFDLDTRHDQIMTCIGDLHIRLLDIEHPENDKQ